MALDLDLKKPDLKIPAGFGYAPILKMDIRFRLEVGFQIIFN